MRGRYRVIHIVHLLLLPLAIVTAQREQPGNIIFMIGDGMGTGQLSALVLAKPGAAVLEFPVAGLSATQSATHFVTESAAGGTALSTGYRTNNASVGLRSDGKPAQTLLEFARDLGKAVGVIATSSVTHATPASFLAHVSSRKLEFDIAEQMAASGADVIFGGGRQWFLPEGQGGKRTDGRNLLSEMQNKGYTVSVTQNPPADGSDKAIWLTANDGTAPAPGRKPTSAEMLGEALRLLSKKEHGFVLMLEGSQIDWACHDNDFARTRDELLDFDNAVRIALDFAAKDGNTLIVVTADHETGGLGVMGTNPDGSDMQGQWLHKEHSGGLVPVLAYGPGAERFGGIQRNDELARKLFHCLGDKAFEGTP
ncbi:MAG: alkaline phosphatase [Bacteroidia bacterium]|nr:alkaline phosphatase [Bacteroidia bacterium]